jgi:hypothetical protein
MGGKPFEGRREDQAPFDGADPNVPEYPLTAPAGFAEEHGSRRAPLTAEEQYEMTNLSPRMTGLPMVVWVSPRGRARHDVRIKVSAVHGSRLVLDDMAVVALRPEPALIAGRLDGSDLTLVREWSRRNEAVLVDYWEGSIDTGELLERLCRA